MNKLPSSVNNIFLKVLAVISTISMLIFFTDNVYCQNDKLKLNDLDYFETPGLNVLVFSNTYTGYFFDEKTAGIEFIHHGVRTATGGGVRLRPTPEQWDQIPMVDKRNVDKENNSIEVLLDYKELSFSSKVIVKAERGGILISVYIDKPLTERFIGKAGFNLEFLPASYFEKTYLMDGKPGIFPLYPSGPMEVKNNDTKIPQFAGHSTFDDRGRNEYVDPKPIAEGKTLLIAPEDPERFVTIKSNDGNLMLYDGRNVAQNGWYIVRTLIPANKTGKVVEWFIQANTIENWKRQPVITYSQVGYHPEKEKIAVIELDKNDSSIQSAALFQITEDGKLIEKLRADVKKWGEYLRYNYLTFDFSSIREPGLYILQYGDQKTKAFPINKNVYDNIWQQSLDVFLPVQMDHMYVNEAYRVWHGRPYMDDALQAPLNHMHFDGYQMGPTTDTKYKPLEHIPGLAVGGWFDAGDFDIQTGSHNAVVSYLSAAWENFSLKHDETFIDKKNSFVDIHRPDGVPDLLQQIEHGTLQLVAQQKNIGHAVRGIIVPNLHQYHHLGDAVNETDNLIYNSNLKPYEVEGNTSGTFDDRWVFTNRIPYLNYGSVSALAAASRALKVYNSQLSEEALSAAIGAWNKEHNEPITKKSDEEDWFLSNAELPAALQLYISTKEEKYASRFNELIWPVLDKALNWNILTAAQAVQYFDEDYRIKLKSYIQKYKEGLDKLSKQNPFGVPIIMRGWGGNTMVINWAITNYFLNKTFPEIIGDENTFRGLNYIFGCHPASNISFVSGVGTHSKKVAYGNNRADFSFIAGGIVPGLLFLKPDFPENKEDWPFFWGENEYVIDTAAAYILLSNAAIHLLNDK